MNNPGSGTDLRSGHIRDDAAAASKKENYHRKGQPHEEHYFNHSHEKKKPTEYATSNSIRKAIDIIDKDFLLINTPPVNFENSFNYYFTIFTKTDGKIFKLFNL